MPPRRPLHPTLSTRLRLLGAALGRKQSVPAQESGEIEALRYSVARLQERLRDVERRALDAQHLEVMGRLSARVVHDLNNLLGVVSSSAHLIGRLSADSQVTILLATILRSVEKASRMTHQLLQLANHRSDPRRRVDLRQLLPAQKELLQAVLGTQIGLSIEVHPRTPAVEVDPGELLLALVNLAMNAAQAIHGAAHVSGTGAALGQVQLLAQPELPEARQDDLPARPRVSICLADDGRGLDEEQAARAFDMFFTLRTAEAASGLGLAQVKRFCESSGGEARLHSTRGLGTVVSMLLPSAPAG